MQLVSFQARSTGAAVHLAWRTASEVNNAEFVAERAVDGANFTPLAQLAGQGTTA